LQMNRAFTPSTIAGYSGTLRPDQFMNSWSRPADLYTASSHRARLNARKYVRHQYLVVDKIHPTMPKS
jgi:hypothetical protein